MNTKIHFGRLLPSVIVILSILSACSSSDSPTPTDEPMDEAPDMSNPDGGGDGSTPNGVAVEATYRVTFDATWSAATHPVNFPSNPHFSPLVGAVHSEQAVFWERGQIASPGIEQMAETGGTANLLSEIETVINEGRALSSIRGGGIGTSPGATTVQVTVNQDYPLVTLVSMLAPSPDWFVGVNSLSLLDDNGDFSSAMTVDLRLYDSGTDSGSRFDSGNADLQPPLPIALVTSIATDSDFVNGEPIVGSFQFEKIP